MASKTFVLGAGFSAGAGFSLVRSLRHEVLEFTRTTTDSLLRTLIDPKLPEFPNRQLLDHVQAVDPLGSMGFEELLFALPRPSAAAYVLRSSCAKLLWAKQGAIRALPDSYRNFASWMNELHGVGRRNAVLSLNWELLAERAFQQQGVPWGYSGHSPVPVIKPHGSINWSKHRQVGVRADFNGWQPISPGSPYSYIPTDPNDPHSIGAFSDPFSDGINDDLRYMIFPGDPEDEPGVTRIWSEAEQLIRERDVVVFIGYSMPPYDAPARDFFHRTTKGKTVEVYTDSADVLDNYRKFLSVANVVTRTPIKFESCPYALDRFK
jgi:hypothetical protein